MKQAFRLWLLASITLIGISSAQALSLEEAIREAKKNHLQLKLSEARVQQASAVVGQRWSEIFPHVESRMERMYNDREGTRRLSQSVPLGLDDEDLLNLDPIDAYQISVRLRQVFYDTTIPKKLAIAGLKKDLAVLEYDQSLQDVIRDVTVDFYVISSLQEEVSIASHNVSLLTALAEETKSRQTLRKETKETVYEIQQRLSQGKLELIEKQQALQLAINGLSQKIGRKSTIQTKFDPPKWFPEDTLDTSSALGVLEYAKQNRSDIKELDLEIAVLDEEIKIAKKKHWPMIVGSIDHGFTSADGFQIEKDNQDWGWSILASVPIFDGFEGRELKKQLKSMIQEKEWEKTLILQEIRNEINQALYEIKRSSQVIETNKDKLIFAKEKIKSRKKKYELDRVTALELMEAKQYLYLSKKEVVIAKNDLAIAYLKLYHAMGSDLRKGAVKSDV